MSEFRDLLPEFIEEARDHLGMVEATLVEVESAVREQRIPEPETLDRLFRESHALYSGAEFVEAEHIEQAAASLAELFNFLRNGDNAPDLDIITIAMSALDAIKSALEDTPGAPESTATAATLIKKLIADRLPDRLRRSAETAVSPIAPESGVRFSVSAYTIERKRRRGTFYLIAVSPEHYTAATGQTMIHLSETLASLGEVLDTVSHNTPDGSPMVSLLYHTLLPPEALRLSLTGIPEDMVTPIPREQIDTLITTSVTENQAERRTRRETDAFEAVVDSESFPPREMPRVAPEKPPTPSAEEMPAAISDTEIEWEHCAEFVTFFLDHEVYAVPIFLVHDIKEIPAYSRLPNQPPAVLGVINLRGTVVPLFDLRRLIGLPPRPFDRKTVMIILQITGKTTGIVVDAISDVASLDPQAKQTPPLLARTMVTEYVRFIGTDRKNNTFLIVLDIEKILAPLLADP